MEGNELSAVEEYKGIGKRAGSGSGSSRQITAFRASLRLGPLSEGGLAGASRGGRKHITLPYYA